MEENLTSCRNQMNLRFYQAQGQEVLGRLETKEQLLRLAVQGDAAAEKLQATIAQVKRCTPVHLPPNHPAPPSSLTLLFQGEKVLRAAKMGLKLKHEVLPQLFAPLHLPPEEHTQVRSRAEQEGGQQLNVNQSCSSTTACFRLCPAHFYWQLSDIGSLGYSPIVEANKKPVLDADRLSSAEPL